MKRSKFSLSSYKLFSCDMGDLIPIQWFEVLPGDSIQQTTEALVRASPLLAPVMHPTRVHIRHFFVPNRLLWDNWEDFITGGPDGLNASQAPTVQAPRPINVVGSLGDYLGLPPAIAVGLQVSALPFRAYSLIWNEYFRDQDLQAELVVNKLDGVDGLTNVTLQKVNYEKDYFTTARPWEQKGAAVNLPVNSNNSPPTMINTVNAVGGTLATTAVNPGILNFPNAGAVAGTVRFGGNTGLQISIQQLREAFAVQRYEENRARFGSRYVEYLRYLGVRSSDARLQRPEYLGGGEQTIQFSEVLQTAEGTDPVGDLKGHGIAAMRSNRYRRFFEEHGIVMSLMSIRPKSIYMNGIDRAFLRTTKDDYWQKEFEHIGQQEVWTAELYAATGGHHSPTAIFGYQDRYDEYRRKQSTVAGEFRQTLLNYWHFGRDFASQPALNSAFITANAVQRPFAVPSQDTMYIMAHNSIQARRLVGASGARSFAL